VGGGQAVGPSPGQAPGTAVPSRQGWLRTGGSGRVSSSPPLLSLRVCERQAGDNLAGCWLALSGLLAGKTHAHLQGLEGLRGLGRAPAAAQLGCAPPCLPAQLPWLGLIPPLQRIGRALLGHMPVLALQGHAAHQLAQRWCHVVGGALQPHQHVLRPGADASRWLPLQAVGAPPGCGQVLPDCGTHFPSCSGRGQCADGLQSMLLSPPWKRKRRSKKRHARVGRNCWGLILGTGV
jgi:hypothetical protein